MAFDKENEPGDELEDFGDELSSDYKEETEEGLGDDEGEEIEEEVTFEVAGSHGMPSMPWALSIAMPKRPTAPNPCRGYPLTVATRYILQSSIGIPFRFFPAGGKLPDN